MKRIILFALCLAMALGGAAMAESAEKLTLGTINMNGQFELRCAVPEGYQAITEDLGAVSDNFLALIRSEDTSKPVMTLSIAFDELLADVDRLNDLDEDALAKIEQTFRSEDEVEITYLETAHGTKLMLIKEVRDTVEYVDFYTIYKGYEVEFLLASGATAETPLTDEQIQLAVQFLSDLDFVDVPAASDSLHAAIQPVTDTPAWIAALPQAQDAGVTQLFVVAGMGMDKTTASISMHQRDENGAWKQILSTPGYVGRNGLCPDADHKEGCGQTPIGVYRFNKAFGIAADPGCTLPYTQVDDSVYWSGDENRQYNQMVRIQDVPELDMANSEHIVDYEYQYQYCLNISFNEEGAAGRGSAIFLHCFGPLKPYTGGCVAVPEYIMKQIMQRVQADCVVVIDTLDNLGGTL